MGLAVTIPADRNPHGTSEMVAYLKGMGMVIDLAKMEVIVPFAGYESAAARDAGKQPIPGLSPTLRVGPRAIVPRDSDGNPTGPRLPSLPELLGAFPELYSKLAMVNYVALRLSDPALTDAVDEDAEANPELAAEVRAILEPLFDPTRPV